MIKSLRILSYVIFLALLVSYFQKERLIDIGEVSEASKKDPVQLEAKSKEKIVFEDRGYTYESEPLFEYTVTGIVVSMQGYNILESQGPNVTAPYDLCMVWGRNVTEKTYLSGVKFWQDQRFCAFRIDGQKLFYPRDVSNNHLIIKDKESYKVERSINVGDEVEVKGYLVKTHGYSDDQKKRVLNWTSSTSRDDTGAGACEVILVDSIRVINRANPVAYWTYQITKYLLPLLLVVRFFIFFFTATAKKKEDKVKVNFSKI